MSGTRRENQSSSWENATAIHPPLLATPTPAPDGGNENKSEALRLALQLIRSYSYGKGDNRQFHQLSPLTQTGTRLMETYATYPDFPLNLTPQLSFSLLWGQYTIAPNRET